MLPSRRWRGRLGSMRPAVLDVRHGEHMSEWEFLHDMFNGGYSPDQIAEHKKKMSRAETQRRREEE
jgi:hypothetical protein